jgi:hypothetical protein
LKKNKHAQLNRLAITQKEIHPAATLKFEGLHHNFVRADYILRRISSSTTGVTVRPEHEYVRRRRRKRAGLRGPHKSASLKSSRTSCNAATCEGKIGFSVLKAMFYAAAFGTVRCSASRTSSLRRVDTQIEPAQGTQAASTHCTGSSITTAVAEPGIEACVVILNL